MDSHVTSEAEEAPVDDKIIHVICFSSLKRFSKLSCNERPTRRGPALAVG